MPGYGGFTAAQRRAHQKYMSGMGTIQVRTTPENREAIKAAAESAGQSLNAYILEAVMVRMEKGRVSPPALSGGSDKVHDGESQQERNSGGS